MKMSGIKNTLNTLWQRTALKILFTNKPVLGNTIFFSVQKQFDTSLFYDI